MSHTTPSLKARYGMAIILVLLAGALEHTINYKNDPEATPIFFIMGGLLSAWFGGMGPGLLTTGLALLACDYVYLTPYHFLHNSVHENLWLAIMGLSGLLFSLLCGVRSRNMARLRVRARQQQMVAAFGNRALQGASPAELMREAVRQTAAVLQASHVAIVQPDADGRMLRIKAQCGWEPPLEEAWAREIPEGSETIAMVTERSQQPLLSNDLQRDPRFSACPIARELGLHSGISALIRSQDQGWGVMEAFSLRRRHFTQEDLHFLQSMAQTLALAFERQEAEAQRLSLARHQELLLDSTDQGIYGINLGGGITFINRSAAALLGYAPEELLGRNAHEAFHNHRPDGLPFPYEECPIQRTLIHGQGCRVEEEVFWRRDGSSLPIEYSSYPVFKDGELNGAVVTFSDISQRKQAERERAALLQSIDTQRQLFQAVADNAPVGLAILSGDDLRAKWCNVAFASYLDEPYRGRQGKIHGRTIEEFAPQATESGLVKTLMEAATTGRHYVNTEAEYHGFHRGVTYWHCTVTPLPASEGRPADLMLLVMEITEHVLARKRIETLAAQAQASLSQLQAIVSSMNEGIIIADCDGKILLMNPSARRMHGWAEAAEQPESLQALAAALELRTLAGDLVPETGHPLARLLRGETFADIEIQVRGLESARYWIANCSGSAVRNAAGKAMLAVLTLRDVTMQKESEAERRRLLQQIASEQARLNAIFENAPEAIVVVDEECRIAMANPVAEILFERPIPVGESYESHAALQLCQPDGESIPPRELPLTRSTLDGEVLSNIELAIALPGRGRRAILMNTAPTFDTLGKISGAIAVFQDVTASKEVERERQRLQQELSERAEELARLNHAKDEFLAMLAHELRNPLAPIVNSIHIIKRHGSCAHDAGLERSIEMIERQTRHMARLLDDLLDVARITSGKIALQPERLDLGAIARQAAESCRATIDAHRHALTLKLTEKPLWVEADPARMEQIVANLLNNAAKYTPRGGAIELEATATAEEAVLRVRDNGIGIAPEMLTRVFELFSQAAPTMDRAQGGLGIGLTIVKRLVELHGGRVEARSEGLGRGCEFLVRLPLRESPEPALAAAPQAMPANGACDHLRVLIVEDNYDTALAMSEVIEIWGHEVRMAYDGSSAIEMARIYQPDVMLLDIGLPEMDGFQVAGTLREDPRFNGTVMIAISGYGQDEDIRRSREAGINHHFTKPVNLAMLQGILNDLHHRDD